MTRKWSYVFIAAGAVLSWSRAFGQSQANLTDAYQVVESISAGDSLEAASGKGADAQAALIKGVEAGSAVSAVGGLKMPSAQFLAKSAAAMKLQAQDGGQDAATPKEKSHKLRNWLIGGAAAGAGGYGIKKAADHYGWDGVAATSFIAFWIGCLMENSPYCGR